MDQQKQGDSGGKKGGVKINWTREFMASAVVFLVALPLCMGIAIASGVPPALGLISGVIGGLVVGSLAGAPLQVSGPAAGLAVIVFELVKKHGLPTLGIIVLVAGLIQLVAGYFKLGRWFRAVSPAVIHGMLAGIGVLIFGSQFHVMVDDKPRGSGLANLMSIPESIYKGIFPLDGSVHHLAAAIGILTIVTLILWNLFKPKKLSLLPAPLLAVTVATIATVSLGWGIETIPVPDNLWNAMNVPPSSVWSKLLDPSILLAAAGMAVVASAESLLCATATDQLHQGERADYDKELMAQGVGNMVAGGLGALPITGVIVRSSANIEAGAETRASAILHALWLLAFVAALPFVLKMIPTSCLAAVLVYIGYKLVNYKMMKQLWKTSRSELGIYLATIACIVSIDLLSGVMIGVALSVLKLVYTFSHIKITVLKEEGENRYDIFVEGAATFIRLPELAETLERLPLNAELHIHVGRLSYIDHACIELLDNWDQQLKDNGGKLVVEWDDLEARFKGKPAFAGRLKDNDSRQDWPEDSVSSAVS